MAHYACIVQAGQTPEREQARLAQALAQLAQETFGDPPEQVEIQWISVPEGFGFTAGQPSTSSLVVRSVPVGFPDEQRERFMSQVTRLWQDVTGCTADEIVVTALDGPLPL
jgi:phenylpyruvate tautomerase PptA (4-oxalocrotonate tautomerase family)